MTGLRSLSLSPPLPKIADSISGVIRIKMDLQLRRGFRRRRCRCTMASSLTALRIRRIRRIHHHRPS